MAECQSPILNRLFWNHVSNVSRTLRARETTKYILNSYVNQRKATMTRRKHIISHDWVVSACKIEQLTETNFEHTNGRWNHVQTNFESTLEPICIWWRYVFIYIFSDVEIFPLYGGLFSDTLQLLSFNVNRSVRFESPIVPSCCCRPSRQLLETCLLNAASRPIYPSPWAQRKK